MTTTPVRRGLVLGAGAALGAAWTVGALCALAEVEGYDPCNADVVVGTSAGSVVASLIACGVTAEELARRLDAGAGPRVEGTGPVNPFDVNVDMDAAMVAMSAMPRPLPLPGNLWLAARTVSRPGRYTLMTAAAGLAPRGRGSLAPVAEMISDAEAGRGWPTAPRTWIVAMDFDTGRRVVFGRGAAPAVPLRDAVIASCAAPGFFPPVRIGARRYVDGGAVSVTNADVLLREELDEVLVLAPMATLEWDRQWSVIGRLERRLRKHWTNRMQLEVSRLTAGGAKVRVLAPTIEDLDAMGMNVMNPARRQQVLHTALRTTRHQLRQQSAAGGQVA